MKKSLLLLTLVLFNINILVASYKFSYKKKQQNYVHLNVNPHLNEQIDIIPEKYSEVKPKHELPEFVEVPVFREINDRNKIYSDVLSHSKSLPFGNQHGRPTNVHETAHGIHSYLRNAHSRISDKEQIRFNGFYVLGGKGVVIKEPNFKRSLVKEFVPENLRSYRWDTYFEKTMGNEWEDNPLYILDEWSAYVLDAKAAIEDARYKRQTEGTINKVDAVSGCLDFSIYSLALCMAIEKYDPIYWKENKQFKSFMFFQLKEANEIFKEGIKYPEFVTEKQDKLLKELLSSDSGLKFRELLKNEFESVWLE